MPQKEETNIKFVIIVVMTIVVTFLLDLQLPLGVACGVPYVGAVLFSLWFHNEKYTWYVAIVCTVLTMAGLYFSPPGGILWIVLTNRFFALAVIWAAAILGLQRKEVLKEFKKNQQMLEVSQRSLKEFSGKILKIREEEKKILSSNLHDEVGSLVVSLSSCLKIAEVEIKDKNFEGALSNIQQAEDVLKREVENFKKIAVELRPPNLDTIGLSGALREYFANVTKQVPLRIEFDIDLDEAELNEDVSIALYRVAQEALNNIIKYAKTKKAVIQLKQMKDEVKFTVCDEGKGFDVEKNLKDTTVLRMGIRGMRERVESLGGTFVLESVMRRGTKINITLPLNGRRAGEMGL